MLRVRPRVFLTGGVIVLAVAYYIMVLRAASSVSLAAPDIQANIDGGTAVGSEEWISALEQGKTVRFLLPSKKKDGGGSKKSEVDLKGHHAPLDEAAKHELRMRFLASTQGGRLQLHALRERMDPSSSADMLAEAELMTSTVIRETVLDLLDKDQYVAFSKGQPYPKMVPGAIVSTNNIVVSRGTQVDVVFFMGLEDHPRLRSASRSEKEVTRYRRVAVFDEFNSLSLGERKEKHARHLLAREALRKGPPVKVDLASLSANPESYRKYREWRRKHEKHLLGFAVDSKTFLATLPDPSQSSK